ncbi:MAG: hypothetical protein R6U27_08030 [Desulfobacterales bacterium]
MIKKKNAQITIGYSTHRTESLSFAAGLMASHDVIILEDPPTPGFEDMLKSKMGIDEYLQHTDTEYPDFAHLQLHLVREQYKIGKIIFQVEPFIEILLKIHEFFADGGSPDQIETGTLMFDVYQAEKHATGHLLAFYQASMNSGFEQIVEAVKNFAKADAARFRLRDNLRAQAIEKLIPSYSSIYVESGEIHIALCKELRKLLNSEVSVKPRFIMEPVYRKLSGKRHIFSPGDILTLYYVFHPQLKNPILDTLASRSLIYSKLLEKNEIIDTVTPYPHTRNEVETIRKVNALNREDCENLFKKIRLASSLKAQRIVDQHLA